MVRHMFKAFESKEAAKEFQSGRGGVLVGSDSTFNRDKRLEWACAVEANGLNPEKYPFAVVWNETAGG